MNIQEEESGSSQIDNKPLSVKAIIIISVIAGFLVVFGIFYVYNLYKPDKIPSIDSFTDISLPFYSSQISPSFGLSSLAPAA